MSRSSKEDGNWEVLAERLEKEVWSGEGLGRGVRGK